MATPVTVSTHSISEALDFFRPILTRVGAAKAIEYGLQVFALADALDANHAVRAALSNPNYPESSKVTLVDKLMRRADPQVRELLEKMVRSRWTSDTAFSDGVSRLGYECYMIAAEDRGVLEKVENEVFRFERTLVGSRALRIALGDPDVSVEQRVATATALLKDKADPITVLLVQRACGALRGRHIPVTLQWIVMHCAQRRHRLLAMVTAAVALSREQVDRIGMALERMYGRAVQVNVSIDPDVIGGVRLQVGDDVLDATVVARLAEAKRHLTA